MDELIITVIENAPQMGAILWIVYRQSKQLDRVLDALIRRENCTDDDDIASRE